MRLWQVCVAIASRIRFERADSPGYWQVWELSIDRDAAAVEFDIVNATAPLERNKLVNLKDGKSVTRYITWCHDVCFIEVDVDGSLSDLTFTWRQDAKEIRAIAAGEPVVQWTYPHETRLACPKIGDAVHLGCSSPTECRIDVPCDEDDVREPIRCHNGIWDPYDEDRNPRCVPPESRWRVFADGAIRFQEISFRRNSCLNKVSTIPGRDGVAFGKGKLNQVRKVFDGDSETYYIPPKAHPFVEFRFRESTPGIQCVIVETGPYKGSLFLQRLGKKGWENVMHSSASEYREMSTLLAPLSTNETETSTVVCDASL